jgi:hypothetical protein
MEGNLRTKKFCILLKRSNDLELVPQCHSSIMFKKKTKPRRTH